MCSHPEPFGAPNQQRENEPAASHFGQVRRTEPTLGRQLLPPLDRAWVGTHASGRLSGRAKKGTKPELMLRRALHALGARYRLHREIAPRLTADIAFPGPRVAVWVDGCFWHSCPRHGKSGLGGPNAERWAAKFARNRERDERACRLAEAAGWRTLRLWECQVIEDPIGSAERVRRLVRRS